MSTAAALLPISKFSSDNKTSKLSSGEEPTNSPPCRGSPPPHLHPQHKGSDGPFGCRAAGRSRAPCRAVPARVPSAFSPARRAAGRFGSDLCWLGRGTQRAWLLLAGGIVLVPPRPDPAHPWEAGRRGRDGGTAADGTVGWGGGCRWLDAL